jgi:hypothetical protein
MPFTLFVIMPVNNALITRRVRLHARRRVMR